VRIAVIKQLCHIIFTVLLTLSEQAYAQEHNLLFKGLDGKHHSLNEYIGKEKWVVVNVWATACPACRRELFDLASFHDRHHEKDAIVIGLTLDLESFEIPDEEYLASFASTYLIDYPLLLVSGELASKSIGIPVTSVPTTFFYNPNGEMVYRINGELTMQVLEDTITNKKAFYRAKRTNKTMHFYNIKSE